MPITSSQVSNIISGQVGMFSASVQYAQAMSAQYGFQPSAAPFGHDPRQVQQFQQGQIQAGQYASSAARAPGMAMGAVGLSAAFGFAPAMMDPFTSTIRAGAAAYGSGGAAGALGAGMATAGVYAGIGAAGGWAANQVITGAQNRSTINAAMGGIFPGMSQGGMGAMAGQVEMMHRQGMGSIRELTGVMSQGAATGQLDTSSLTQFSSSFRKLISNVRDVANALNSSLTEANQAMQSVKMMGVGSGQAAGFLGTMRGVGLSAGISPDQMMGIAAQGASMGRNMGFGRETGAMGAVVQAGVHGLAQKQGMPGVLGDSRGRYTSAAMRFLGGSKGKTVLGAMMNQQGQLDMGMASQIAGGTMDWKDIQQAYRENVHNPHTRDMLKARTGELAGGFISEFGGAGVASPLNAAVQGSGTSSPESMLNRLSGLNRMDLNAMNALSGAGQRLRSRLASEAQMAFRQGQQDAGLSATVERAIESMVKPYKEKFREFGADMQAGISDALGQISKQFDAPSALKPLTASQFRQGLGMLDRYSMNEQLGGGATGPSGGGMGQGMGFGFQRMGGGWTGDMSMGRGSSWAQGLAGLLPSAMQWETYGKGTGLDEMPGYGLGTHEYSGGITGAWALGKANFFGGGRNALSFAGDMGRGAFGRGLGFTKGGQFAAKGFGGLASNSLATLRGGLGAGWLAGAAGSLGGRALGALSTPLMMYDAITNSGPAMQRQMGRSAFTHGAISGDASKMIEHMADMGMLSMGTSEGGGHDVYRLGTGGNVGGLSGTPTGLIPMTSGFQAGANYGDQGSQLFLSQQGHAQLQRMAEPETVKAIFDKVGGKAGFDDVIARIRKKGGRDWEQTSDSEKMPVILKALADEGKEITPEELGAIMLSNPNVGGKSVFKNVQEIIRRNADPDIVRDRATAKMMTKFARGSVKFIQAQAHNFKKNLTDADISFYADEAGLPPEAFGAAKAGILMYLKGSSREHPESIPGSKIGMPGMKWTMSEKEQQDAGISMSPDDALQTMFNKLGYKSGGDPWSNRAYVAESEKTDEKGAMRRGLYFDIEAAAMISGDPTMGLLVQQARDMNANEWKTSGKENLQRDVTDLLKKSGHGGLDSREFSVAQFVEKLRKPDGFAQGDLGGLLAAGANQESQMVFHRAITDLRETSQKNQGRNQYFIRQAAGLMGVDRKWGRHYLSTFERVHEDGKDQRLAARSAMINDLQSKLEAGEIDPDDLKTLAMTMGKSGTGFGSDVSQAAARLYNIRGKTRKKGHTGAFRKAEDVLLGTMGINVKNTKLYSKDDVGFIRGDHDVMSTRLALDLEDAARQLVESEFGADKVDDVTVRGKMAELTQLITSGDFKGLEQQLSSMSPVSLPGGAGSTAQAASDISKYAPQVAAAFKLVASAAGGKKPDGTK